MNANRRRLVPVLDQCEAKLLLSAIPPTIGDTVSESVSTSYTHVTAVDSKGTHVGNPWPTAIAFMASEDGNPGPMVVDFTARQEGDRGPTAANTPTQVGPTFGATGWGTRAGQPGPSVNYNPVIHTGPTIVAAVAATHPGHKFV